MRVPYSLLVGLALIFNSSARAQSKEEITRNYLQRAASNIEKFRKGTASLQLVDKAGQPVTSATIEIRQKKHDFLFGSLLDIQDKPEPYRKDFYLTQFNGLFNYATLAMYWGDFVKQQGAPAYPKIEETLRWCKANDITVIGHALVWVHWLGIPSWLPQYSPQTQEDLLKAWIINTVGGYKGQIDTWDILNESINTRLFFNQEAQADYMFEPIAEVADFAEKVFNWAHEANPAGTFILNDFGMISNPVKRQRFIDLVKALKQKKAPVTALGIQCHEPREEWYSPPEVWETFDQLAALGFPVYVTELHPQSSEKVITGAWREGKWTEEAHAEFTEEFVRLSFGHPAVKCINWHGLSDRGIWLEGGGLIDENYHPKPVYSRMMKLIHEEWTTNLQERPDKNGTVNFRGFYGKYEITVTTGTSQKPVTLNIHLAENEENKWVFTINDH